jgi:hypothetical protein
MGSVAYADQGLSGRYGRRVDRVLVVIYRRVVTMIFVPVALRHTSSVDMMVRRDLRAAHLQDRAAHQTPEVKPTRLVKKP